MLQFLASGGVVHQGGAGEKQRSFLREADGIEGRNSATGSAKQHHVPARAENVQALVKGGLAHGVIYNIYTGVIGQPFGFSFKILLRITNNFVRTRGARQSLFSLRRHSSDNPRSDVVSHLHEQLADAPGGGMDQSRLSLL